MTEDLSPEELRRYARQLALPGVGPEGQAKLKRAGVLIVGAGGLGSPAALYLAAAGVGRIGLVDDDAVDLSNLQRQILYSAAEAGRPKLDCARERLLGLNPAIEVEPHPLRLDSANAAPLIERYDVVLDGTDSLGSRYAVNDACVRAGKPNVHASLFRFEGRLSTYWAGRGPCYRCVQPEPQEEAASCEEAGVLGAVAGALGTLQAVEALKLVLGLGEPLVGRLLLFDGLRMSWKGLAVRRDPACAACGSRAEAAPVSAARVGTGAPLSISPDELKARLDGGEAVRLLDVREPAGGAGLPGALPMPLGELPGRLGELDRGTILVACCRTGLRSAAAARLLRAAGFSRAMSLDGGLAAWTARYGATEA